MSLNKPSAVVLYNRIDESSPEDVIDNRTQAEWISEELEALGYDVTKLQFTPDSILMLEGLKKTTENLTVVNMVDSAPDEDNLAYLVPAVLDYLKVKYTGCSHEALFLTTNKVYAKQILHKSCIRTPAWVYGNETGSFIPGKKYIIKALSEDSSIGLCDGSVILAESLEQLQKAIAGREQQEGKPFFAEEFIEGRELNVCIYGSMSEPVILPPYEWIFDGFDEQDKVKIINYDAKWTENTYEYEHVIPQYHFSGEDGELLTELKAVSKACWKLFKLKGYARIDFRIDSEGSPWMLEINCNPSFYGFRNIARHNGLDFKEILKSIVEAVYIERVNQFTCSISDE